MLTVIATYRVAPEAAQTVADVLASHAVISEQEPGCRQFLAHQTVDDPARFFLYETYDSVDAFEAHRASKHFKENIEGRVAPLLIEREWHMCSAPLRTKP